MTNQARPDAFDALNELADHVFDTAKTKGFHDDPVPMSVSAANLHSEVSELWEAFRNNSLNSFCDKAEKMKALGLSPLTNLEEEIADIVIRALDTARENGIDVGNAVRVKDAYNKTRPHKNGGKAA
jgi:NTP pyrophosphatase (non-canonical NTP hydrolase)